MMEISWKCVNLCLVFLFSQVCNGFPIHLEGSVADKHADFLTGVVAVLLTICSIALLAGCVCCQRKNGFKEFRDSPVIASAASNLDHGHVNPVANGEFTIFTPLSHTQYNNIFLPNDGKFTPASQDYIQEDVNLWFNESEKDFPRIKLKYIKELGKGWFGKVVLGAAKQLQNEKSWTPVVVRILEATASGKERLEFLNDARIYKYGTHPNILFLIGRCLETIPLLLLQEYCTQGDLKHYLRTKKENADELLSTDYPLLWCHQLSSALKHLHDNNVTHPDLAARNCQLMSNLTLKLGDYGLSAFNYPEDYYQGSSGVPVRWCSPESLNCTSTTIQPKKSTPESNVWSFSVTMWEILECGEQPYPGLNDDEVVSQVLVSSNVRLTRPSHAFIYTDYMYRLMQLCWTSVDSRPTMAQINLMITDLLQVHENTKNNILSGDDFDKRWELFKPNALIKTDSKYPSINSEIEELQVNCAKQLSPSSLNNLQGSLNNLLLGSCETEMNSWFENILQSNDENSCQGIETLSNPLVQHISDSDSSKRASPKLQESKINIDLAQKFNNNSERNFSDHSQRTSSESETEDENWRNKVERGAYTEKVRLKSKSVADLMILTHIDCSESDPETPLPSLDYRINYKNVRYSSKNNSDNTSLIYRSEGNLLNVHDAFQDELKKIKEERRDSLLFVPENHSQSSFPKLDNSKDDIFTTVLALSDSNRSDTQPVDSPAKHLMHKLNSTADIKPANQIYNVFNVTIDKPMQVNNCKLNEIINFDKDMRDFRNFKSPELIDSKVCGKPKNFTDDLFFNINKLHNNKSLYESDSCITNIKHISGLNQTYPASNGIENDDTNDLTKSDEDELSDLREDETTSKIAKEIINFDVDFKLFNDSDKPESVESNIDEKLKKIEWNFTDDSFLNGNDQQLQDNRSASESQNCIIKHINQPTYQGVKRKETIVTDSINNLSDVDHKLSDIIEDETASNEAKEANNFNQAKPCISQVPSLSDIIQNKLSRSARNCHVEDRSNEESQIKDTELYDSSTSPDNKENGNLVDQHFESNDVSNNEILKNNLTQRLNVTFDLSSNQEEILPDTLTHVSGYTSTPCGKEQKQSLPPKVGYSSLNLFNSTQEEDDKELSGEFAVLEDSFDENNKELNYSLETWDNFLGKTLDDQKEVQNESLFDSFTSEPHSLLFIQNGDGEIEQIKPELDDDVINRTFLLDDKPNKTFIMDKPNQVDNNLNETFVLSSDDLQADDILDDSSWENGEGWFLHPQNNEELSGPIEVTSTNTNSCIGFGIDDDIMDVIRNELLSKLPQAQVATSEEVQETEEWDSSERDEVFIKYNGYNPPLSPIIEESFVEEY